MIAEIIREQGLAKLHKQFPNVAIDEIISEVLKSRISLAENKVGGVYLAGGQYFSPPSSCDKSGIFGLAL